MKKLIVVLTWVLLAASCTFAAGGDSLSFPFWLLDSAGNMGAALASPDSIFLTVFYPNGSIAWQDTNAYNGTNVTGWTTVSGTAGYSWKESIANLDGTTTNGVYSYILVVRDAAPAIKTPFRGQFTVYSETAGDITPRDVNVASVSNDAINLETDVTAMLPDSNVASITVADVNVGSVSNDAINLVSDVTGALPDSNVATIDVNVASVTDGAIVSADLAAAVYGRIADTVWQNDTASVYAGGAGSIGDAIRDSAYDAGMTVATIWTYLQAQMATTEFITSISIAADAIDASAIADNAIDASAVANNTIDSSAIAAGAITGYGIATDALTSTQLATSAVSEFAQVGGPILADSVWRADSASYNGVTARMFNMLKVAADTSQYLLGSTLADATIDSLMKRPIADTITGSWVGLVARASDSAQKGVSSSSVGTKVWTTPATRTITGTASGAIATASFATGAITSTVLAADAIGASQIAADAITSSELGGTAVKEISDTLRLDSMIVDGSALAATTGAITATTMAADAIGASELAADAITSSELGGAAADEVADSTWRSMANGYTSYAGSFGDVIYDSLNAKVSTAGSSAAISGADMAQIADSVWERASTSSGVRTITGTGADAITATSIAADALGSSELAASATAEIASAVGTAASNWSDAQRDSVLAAIADAGKVGLTKTGIDSVKNAVADTHVEAKVWTNPTVRTLSSYDWTSVQRDSVLNAILDNSWKTKTWGSTSTRTLTALDEDATTIDLDGSTINIPDTTKTGKQIALMPDHWTAADSLGFQGTGANAGAIADAVLDEVISGHTVDGSLGEVLHDSLDAKVSTAGSTASISDADMGDIIDSLFLRVNTDTINGSLMGHLVRGASEATLDSAQVARAVWNTPHANHTTSTTFGGRLDAATSSRSSHSALDVYNTFLSGTNERAFWLSDSVQAAMAAETADSIGSLTATVDSSTVARAVWNAPGANHVAAGTFGSRLDAAVSSIAGLSGSGAYTRYVYVVDTSTTPDSVVTSAVVYVNNRAQNTTPYQATTDNNGRATFNLGSGNWVKFTTEPGYGAEVDSFTVSGSGADTLKLYRDGGDLTTIAWLLEKPNGARYANATVTFDIVAAHDSMLYVADTTIPAERKEDYILSANTSGYAWTNLWPNATITGDSSYYLVTARDSKGRLIQDPFKVRIPVADTVVYINRLTRW